MPKGQLSRKELAFKASGGEQRFKASQDSVKASKGTGAKERTIRTPIAKLSRKDIADYSGSGGTAKTKLASRSKPQPIAPASKRSAPSAPGKVVQSPAGASYAKQVQNTVKRSKSKTVRSYTQPGRAPVVKLTNPQRSSSYKASGSRVATPKVSHMSRPKPQVQSGYKAPVRTASPPKQKFSGPAKSTAKSSSRSKQKQREK